MELDGEVGVVNSPRNSPLQYTVLEENYLAQVA